MLRLRAEDKGTGKKKNPENFTAIRINMVDEHEWGEVEIIQGMEMKKWNLD